MTTIARWGCSEMNLQAHSTRTWHRCGSERAVRGALAKMMWKRNKERGEA